MNPGGGSGGGLSPAQAASMFRRQKRQLDRRLEMTDKCVEVAEKLFNRYCKTTITITTEESLSALIEMVYGVLAIQLQQLKLAQAEGKEQQLDFETAIKNAESPIIGPTHQRGGR